MLNSIAIKEQRVDGSWHGHNKTCLRCTLMGCESSNQIRILSNQINRQIIRLYSSKVVQQCVQR